MPKRSHALLIALLMVAIAAPLSGLTQAAPPLVRVLVVDETKTFNSTMRVAGLVGALRSIGMFDVGITLADMTSSYDDPLADRFPEADEDPYDLIIILPRGLDDGTASHIWVVSAGLNALPPTVAAGLDAIVGIIEQVFAGIGEAIDVTEDLWPGLLWAVYSTKGWIR